MVNYVYFEFFIKILTFKIIILGFNNLKQLLVNSYTKNYLVNAINKPSSNYNFSHSCYYLVSLKSKQILYFS